MLLSGAQQRSQEDTSITYDEIEENVLTAETGKKRKVTEQEVLPKRRAKTVGGSKRSRGFLKRDNSKNSDTTEPNTDASHKKDDEHRGDKVQKNRKRATADRVIKVKSSSRSLRVQKDQILNGTHNATINQIDKSNDVIDHVENDDNENQNDSIIIQKDRRKYPEELSSNTKNEMTLNIYEINDEENGMGDNEENSNDHGSDYAVHLEEGTNDPSAFVDTVNLGENYNDPDDDT